jgi:REP element-mobilizing transposase RayT
VPSPPPLLPNAYYHIFNRGINGEDLFRESRNYDYFLKLWALHVLPVADTFAYCLMRNHFHAAVRTKESEASAGFANFFNAYAKAINKTYQRTGGLFENPFRRIHILTDSYFKNVIAYIHLNPQKHGFVGDFRDWKWSSYGALLSNLPTQLSREQVLDWFDGSHNFVKMHLNVMLDKALGAQDFE